MKAPASTSGWDSPTPSPEFLGKHSPEDVDRWQVVVARVADVAVANGWTKTEVSRRSGIVAGTLSPILSGTYLGVLATYTNMLSQWLDSVEESAALAAGIPTSPDFNPRLKVAQEVMETLMWAQLCPDLVMITLGAGMGKTAACGHFARTRPHVYVATMSEHSRTVHGMLIELAAELDVQQYNPAKLARAIGTRLARTGTGTLLIVDEAQHLNDEALNQLRNFVDVYKCGVALCGNNEVYSRFAASERKGPSYAQLKSRVGKRLQRARPYVEDVHAYIAAWGVTDPDSVRFLVGIGMKDGALRQIEKTVKLARMIAVGSSEPMTIKHLQAAWKNRDVEGLA